MKVAEFKAWLEGYLENNSKPEIKRIKEQVDLLEPEVIVLPSTPNYFKDNPYYYGPSCWKGGSEDFGVIKHA